MLENFVDFITKNKLFSKSDHLLLAVSGGVDSMVLVDLTQAAGYTFSIAHCNFALRGEDSDLDEVLVKNKATECQVPFHSIRFETEKYASEKAISIQMAARELRYAWFYELMLKEKYKWLVTAHHKNDSLETALFNLVKGTGLAGLKGIVPKSNKRVSPLLFAEKELLVAYANEHKIVWREDVSNASNKYSRNLIRHEVIPKLQEINPAIYQTFSQTSEKLKLAESALSQYLVQIRNNVLSVVDDDVFLSKEELKLVVEPLYFLFEIVKDFGFNFQQSKTIWQSVEQVGKTFHSSNYQLNIDRQAIIISKKEEESKEVHFLEEQDESLEFGKKKLSITIQNARNYSIKAAPSIAAFDKNLLHHPLQLRTWKKGDWFMPLGMAHKKLISDFLIDEKVAMNHKSKIKLLISNDQVIWVVGMRMDDRFKITTKTKEIMEFTLT